MALFSTSLWADTETITWSGSSLTGSGSTNVTAGTATAVDGSTYHAGTISISSNKIQTESKKHNSNSYYEDFSSCSTEGCTNITSTARIEFPFTIATGYSFSISSLSFKLEQGGGGGPAVHAYIAQANNDTVWLGYTTANTKTYTPEAPATSLIQLSAGTAKFVVVLGLASNLDNNRQFKLSNISIQGSVSMATNYTITYNANGGEGTMENSTNTISACSFTYEGYDFVKWNTEDDGSGDSYYAGDAAPSDLDLYAIWELHQTSSDATLSALSVAGCTFNETFDPATTAYTVDLPFYASMPTTSDVTATKNDTHASDPVISISGNVIYVEVTPESGAANKKTYTITVTIAATPTASTSINIEQWVLDNQKGANDAAGILLAKDLMDAHNISYAELNALDSLNDDPSKVNRNYAYLGMKVKSSSSEVKVILPAEKTLKVKFGERKATIRVSINGSAATDATITDDVYSLAAAEAVREVVFTLSKDKSTCVFKQIMINEDIEAITLPWRITFDSDGGSDVADVIVLDGQAAAKPANPTKENVYFAGWYNGESAYDWTAAVTTNLSLTAHWSDTPTALDNTTSELNAIKRIENGQLIIEKNGVRYNALGQTIR